MRVLITVLCFYSSVIFAGDEHFKYPAYVDKPVSEALAWDNKELAGDISDWGLYGSIVAPYVRMFPRKKDRWRRFGTIAVTQIGGALLSDVVKMRTKRTRPNGQDDRSFFSGHTSISFIGAGLICSYKRDAFCYTGLAVAGLTGYLRISAKKHWLSDVLVGMGVGYAHGRYMPKMIIRF